MHDLNLFLRSMIALKLVLDDIEAIFRVAKFTLDEPTQEDLKLCLLVFRDILGEK